MRQHQQQQHKINKYTDTLILEKLDGTYQINENYKMKILNH